MTQHARRVDAVPLGDPLAQRRDSPNAGPYESAAAPSRSIAARAQSASSSTGMQSGAGMPRAKEIDPIARQSSSRSDCSASVGA